MRDLEIVEGYTAGALGRVAELHGSYYAKHWEFGPFFETKVTTELAQFLSAYKPGRDGFWTVSVDGRVEASVAIDGVWTEPDGAQLRWFIVSDELRGQGVGGRLLRTALDFCAMRGYPSVYLWTFAGLDAARHLYEREGFMITQQQLGTQWGREVLEQRLEWLPTVSA